MTHDRRTFLRHTAVLGGVPTVDGLVNSLGDVIRPDSADIGLRSGMEIGLVFTGFGGQTFRSEVDPNVPDGGRLITVESVEPGERVTITWLETIEREVTPTETLDVGVGTPTPTPAVETVERTGTITASGLADAHESFLPMFWEAGETTTDTSAIWLSRETFRELTQTRQTAWSPDVLTRISWVGNEVQERIHSAVEDVDEDEVNLVAEPEFVDVELTVDSQPTTVQAIKAHDSFGNEYIVVANEENPLVVKFTYNAVSTGITGFDTGLWSLIKAVFSGYRILSIETPRREMGNVGSVCTLSLRHVLF